MICEDCQGRGILPRTTKPNKQAASVLPTPSRPIAQRKEPSMRLFPKHIMLPAWLQYSDHPLVGFCDILKALTNPIKQTDLYRAGNAMQALTIVTLEVN